jgi:Domain of unknown function (DUF697)
MNRPGRPLVRLALLAAGLVLVVVAVFVVNQTAQVVALATTMSPTLGRVVLIVLLVVYAGILVVPVALFARLPQTLRPPADEHSAEFGAYVERLGRRLAGHPLLSDRMGAMADRAAIEAAYDLLDGRAAQLMRATATTVFVSTAISQNGRLDALMVLAAQSRMVWQIAHLYHQRPSLREMVQLYANIAGTVFLVSQLEDMEIEEQVEPVIAATLAGSAASLVPGASMVATLITQSILDGAANAFLTLRIGVICQRYCRSLTAVDRRALRRHASTTAARMLGTVVGASAGLVSRTMLGAARKAGTGAVGSVAGGLRTFGGRVNPFRPSGDS